MRVLQHIRLEHLRADLLNQPVLPLLLQIGGKEHLPLPKRQHDLRRAVVEAGVLRLVEHPHLHRRCAERQCVAVAEHPHRHTRTLRRLYRVRAVHRLLRWEAEPQFVHSNFLN